MGRIVVALVFLAFLAARSAYAAPVAGDVDRSNTADARDVQHVVNVVLGADASSSADIDYSGSVDSMDLQLVVNAVLGIAVDADNDGLCDAAEARFDTDAHNPDSDGDGVCDGQEALDGTLTPNVRPDLGANAGLHGYRPFPDDNPWNTPIDQQPVDPDSDTYIDSIGRWTQLHPDFGANWNGGPFGIPYVVVSGNTPRVPMTFDYADDSDPGPYPIPPNPPIEGGSDRHILVIDRDNWLLYETWNSWPDGNGWWAGSGAVFDLRSNALRPLYATSADAAGLPIFPGLVRYDEVVEQGEIRHALRFTVQRTRRAFVYPARHYASSSTDPALPPMGMRVRLKAGVDISGYPPRAQVILRAMKTYGMILADNGSNWYVSGAPDARWDDNGLNRLKDIVGDNFEVVKMPAVITK